MQHDGVKTGSFGVGRSGDVHLGHILHVLFRHFADHAAVVHEGAWTHEVTGALQRADAGMIDFAGRVHAEGVHGTLEDVHEGEALRLLVQPDGAKMGAVAGNLNGHGAGGKAAAGEISIIINAIVIDCSVCVGRIGAGNLHGTDHDAVLVDELFLADDQRLEEVGILFKIQWSGHGDLLGRKQGSTLMKTYRVLRALPIDGNGIAI